MFFLLFFFFVSVLYTSLLSFPYVYVFLTNGERTRADLARDACPAGYYCPEGAASPYSCPSGTYNPHTGRDGLEDCITSPEGYYTEEASRNMTGPCEAGYYCPAGSTGPQQVCKLVAEEVNVNVYDGET